MVKTEIDTTPMVFRQYNHFYTDFFTDYLQINYRTFTDYLQVFMDKN